MESLVKNAGVPFSLWIWDNGVGRNIGLNAYADMAEKTKTDHIVTVDEDVVEFPKNWLKDLLSAFYDVPPIKKFKTGEIWQPPYWGWLGLMPIQDKYTNGALWPEYMERTRVIKSNKTRFEYRIGMRIPQTCAMIHKETLKKIGGFAKSVLETFYGMDGETCEKIDRLDMPLGLVDNVKIYHACGPYYNKQYEEVWRESREQTIKEAIEQYKCLDQNLKYR